MKPIYKPYTIDYSSISIYNTYMNNMYSIKYKLNNLIVQTPKLYIPFGLNQYNYIDCSLPINNTFESFILSLQSFFCSKPFFKDYHFKSNIQKTKGYPNRLRLIYNNCTIYDKNKEKITNYNILPQSYAAFIIHISHIWIYNGAYGIKWNICQIKLYENTSDIYTDYLFIDSDEDDTSNNTILDSNYDKYKKMLKIGLSKEAVIHKMTLDKIDITPLFPNETSLSNPIIIVPKKKIVIKKKSQVPLRLRPTKGDIEQAIKKLKKISIL